MKDKIFKAPQQGHPNRTVTITSDKLKNGDRFIICDAVTGAVVDNAQGFGFNTHKTTTNLNIKQVNISQIERAMYKDIVNQLVKIADEESRTNSMNLKPGTYTALSIHRILQARDSHYLQHVSEARNVKSRVVTDVTAPFDVYGPSVFYYISEYEKKARLIGNNAHKWTIADRRNVVATSSVAFPTKSKMKEVISIVNDKRNDTQDCVVFSLVDGCIRNINEDYGMPFFGCSIRGEGYAPMNEYQDLSFAFELDQLKYIYGDCKLSLYSDEKGSLASYMNPYSMRLVIENSDRWCVSSDVVFPLSLRYIKLLDESHDQISSPVCQQNLTIINLKQ